MGREKQTKRMSVAGKPTKVFLSSTLKESLNEICRRIVKASYELGIARDKEVAALKVLRECGARTVDEPDYITNNLGWVIAQEERVQAQQVVSDLFKEQQKLYFDIFGE